MIKSTLEEFIEKATKVHGNKYNYSNVVYINNKTPVTIKCNDCGNVFDMRPDYHSNENYGCRVCIKNERECGLLKLFKEIHGDKYDYSETVYVNGKTKIKVFCKYHKEYFYINIGNHLSGSGCIKCGQRVLTKEDFIEKSKMVHGEKYSYDNVNIENMTKKVEILCNIHNKHFLQTPQNHLYGQGCPYCAKVKKKTTEEFIESAVAIHGDKFDYSETTYINARTDVKIFCKQHNKWFMINAQRHLDGAGCDDCKIIKPVTYEEFVSRVISKHGDKYDFSNSKYTNVSTSIELYCNVHNGNFMSTPARLFRGAGCPICFDNNKIKTEDFVHKSKIIHGDLYDYSETVYVNCRTKVKILCNKHKEFFEQYPRMHLDGKGCPSCSNSKGEVKVKNLLESNKIKYVPQYKNSTCVYKNMLRFDFGLFDENNVLVGTIEYNGAQHYSPFDFSRNKHESTAIENFKELTMKDNIKKEWCHRNNIPLLVLRFDEDKNLEQNIKNFLVLCSLDK